MLSVTGRALQPLAAVMAPADTGVGSTPTKFEAHARLDPFDLNLCLKAGFHC